jgi:capsid protein
MIEVPGGKINFYLYRSALCQAEWIGPGKGYVDPWKEVQAAERRIQIGVSSQTDECLEQGKDPDDVRWERKRDMEENRKYGLTPSEDGQAAAGGAGGGEDDDPDAADRNERGSANG